MGGKFAASLGLLALALCQAAAATDKDRFTVVRARIDRGDALLKKGEFARAEKSFRSAIESAPAVPTGHLGLGAALVGQKRFDEALAALEEAERRFVAWEQEINLADLQKRQIAERQMQGFVDLALAARDSRPNPGPGGTAGARDALLNIDRVQTEQFLFRERWNLEGFDAIPPQVFYLEGIAYLRTNRPLLGIEALEICLLIEPGHGLAHYNLAVALFQQGEALEAKRHLDEALAAGVEPHARFVADLQKALG